jgi:hypothetical protein
MTTTTCPHCGGSIGLPHVSEIDCFRELDREIAATVKRLWALNKRKSQLWRALLLARQRAMLGRATDVSSAQKRLAGVPGRRNRRASPLAGRKSGHITRKD